MSQPNELDLPPLDGGRATYADLNFKVAPDFHMRFKLEATKRGVSMKELLYAGLEALQEQKDNKADEIIKDLEAGLASLRAVLAGSDSAS